MLKNEDVSVCSSCGGQCCKTYPGGTIPEDWNAPSKSKMLQKITSAIKSGNWTMDYWEGDPRWPSFSATKINFKETPEWCQEEFNSYKSLPRYNSVYYVRPAIVGKENQITDASWGGICTLLGRNGCSLPFEERPFICKALVPNVKSPGNCTFNNGIKHDKWFICMKWLPYQAILAEIRKSLADE